MAEISQITLPSGSTYDIKDVTARDMPSAYYGTCSTAAATAAKVVEVANEQGFTLKAGALIGVKFTNTNTASNVTLNVNSTGAKSIWYNNAAYTGSANTITGYANRLLFYMYDGTNWCLVNKGWVDDNNTYTAASATPLMDGTAAVGSSAKYAREDHVHPSDTTKVDKETGKGLSTNDYTTTEKNKLAGIAAGAQVNVQSDWNVTDTSSDAFIKNKPTIPTDTWKVYYGTCTTAAATKDKAVTVASDQNFSLRVGAIVGVKFSNTNTYSSATTSPITLNVNSTGAKNIWYNNTHSGAGNTGTSTNAYGYANRIIYYMYDGTYWVWISHSVDNNSTYTAASAAPLMDGTAAVGTSAKYARQDHVHPTDTSRVPTSRTINGKALSSNITLSASDVGALDSSSSLDATKLTGTVPTASLPSYVDDVLEYTNKASFPATGQTGKIYVDKATNLTYRWSGSAYVQISPSLALGTTSSTAYRGDYGNTAYTHATDSSRLTTATSSGLYKVAATAQGHIASLTAVTKADITALGIPGTDTDTKVTQTNTTTNADYRVLFSENANDTTQDAGVRKNTNFKYNPSTGNVNLPNLIASGKVTVGSHAVLEYNASTASLDFSFV